MATQSRPLMNKGVALASAAAIAAATPAIMPTLDVPTHALATAEVQLANFADVMSVPAEVWTDLLFSNTAWGGTLSSGTFGPEWAAPQTVFLQPGYVNPWAGFCNGECFESGISGAAYLFFDALINGDGSGYDNSENWPIGFVNYLFEPVAVILIGGGASPSVQIVNPGLSSATWFVLQGTIGQAFPELTVPIASLFWGPTNISVAYNLALSVAALALSAVPLIGLFLGNSVLAYLGDLQIPGTVQPNELFYQFGLSGTLNYWVDIATGAVPFPTGSVPPAASVAAVPAEAATALASATASATSAALKSDIAQATEAAAPEASPAVEVAEASPAVEVAPVEVEASPAVEVAPVEVAEAAPAVEVADAGPVAEAPESVATSAADLPAVEVADIAAVKAPKRPVRSAVERAAKSVRSALGATKADTAGSNTVSPGRATGSAGPGSPAGSVGSGSTAAESASSDAGSASSDAGSASSDAGSASSDAGSSGSEG